MNLFTDLCKQLKINKTRTSELYPQSDGMVEQFHRTLLQPISMVVDDYQEDWDNYIPLFILAYRSAIHEYQSYTSQDDIFGHGLKRLCDLKFGTPPEKLMPINELLAVGDYI